MSGTSSQPITMSGPPPAFPGDLTWNMASLVSAWIIGPLYGINICVFVLCVQVLYMKGLKGANVMMLIVASVQFALATGHVITILVQLIRAFVGESGKSNGTLLYLLNQATPEHIAQEVFYITNSIIGDAILIWRLWLIWNRKFYLTIPFIVLCFGAAASGYIALGNLSHLSPTDSVFVPRVHDWLLANWSLSIATQLGATLMIGYRFWKSFRWISKGVRASRLAILWIVVESGALYSLTTIFLLGFSATNTGALFASALGQISALCPTLIIVRAGLRGSSRSATFTPVKGSINRSYDAPSQRNPRDVELGSRGSDGPDGMVVHVKEATEIRFDNFVSRNVDTSSSEERSPSPKERVYIPAYYPES